MLSNEHHWKRHEITRFFFLFSSKASREKEWESDYISISVYQETSGDNIWEAETLSWAQPQMRNAGWGGPTINLLRMVLLCALDNAVVSCQMSPGLLLESWIESSCAWYKKEKGRKGKERKKIGLLRDFSLLHPIPSHLVKRCRWKNRFHRVIPGIKKKKKGNNVILNCIQWNWFEGGEGERERWFLRISIFILFRGKQFCFFFLFFLFFSYINFPAL